MCTELVHYFRGNTFLNGFRTIYSNSLNNGPFPLPDNCNSKRFNQNIFVGIAIYTQKVMVVMVHKSDQYMNESHQGGL